MDGVNYILIYVNELIKERKKYSVKQTLDEQNNLSELGTQEKISDNSVQQDIFSI